MHFLLVWLLLSTAPTRIELTPQFARPGDGVLIRISSLSGCSVDFRYRFIGRATAKSLSGSGPDGTSRELLRACTLDSDGRAIVHVPIDMPNGMIVITDVRASGTSEWQPAEGQLQVKAQTLWTRMPTFMQWALRAAAWLAGLAIAWLLAERFRRVREARKRVAAALRTLIERLNASVPGESHRHTPPGRTTGVAGRPLARSLQEAPQQMPASMPRAGEARVAASGRFTPWEWVMLALATAIIAYQILLPPPIGLADNRDGAKIAGQFALHQEDTAHEDYFDYFATRYVFGPEDYHWHSGIASSETILAAVAVAINSVLSKDGVFDIRCLGVVHAALFIVAFVLLLVLLRGAARPVRLGVGLFVLFIFTDVCYTAYFNSFYMDAGSCAFLLVAIVLALRLTRGLELGWLVLFGAASALFVSCKTQHAILVPALVLFLVRVFLAADSRLKRLTAAGFAIVIVAVAAWTIRVMPQDYKAQPLFNEIFFDEMLQSSNPKSDLQELGLGEEYLQYIGTHSFAGASPAADSNWITVFSQRTGYTKLAWFYLKHPARAVAKAKRFSPDLADVRAPNFGNFRRSDGHPPRKLSEAFNGWSDAKSEFFRTYPLTKLLGCFVLLLSGGIALAVKLRLSLRRLAPVDVLFLVLAMAATECTFACYADCLDNGRHLFIFQALLDVALCFAVAGAITTLSRLRSWPVFRRLFSGPPHTQQGRMGAHAG